MMKNNYKMKTLFRFVLLSCLVGVSVAATDAVKKVSETGATKVTQYTIKPGDSAYEVSKKLLTSPQRKSLLNWINTSGNKLALRPKEVLQFETHKGQLVAIEYGIAKKLKRVQLHSAPRILPASTVQKPVSIAPVSAPSENRLLTVKSGDSLMRLAAREKLPGPIQASLLTHASKLKAIKPNDAIAVSWSGKSLKEVVLKRGPSSTPIFHQGGVAQTAAVEKIVTVARDKAAAATALNTNVKGTSTGYRMVSVKIRNNFKKDAGLAGVPGHVIQSVTDLYHRNEKTKNLLTAGSHLDLVYKPNQKQYSVAYAKLTKGVQKHEAILYQNKNGSEYYDAEGRPYQASFLRVPLGQHRLSSSFSIKRKHPVTGRVKPHYGVDFAAKTGDPVWASAAGKVVFAGYQRGYGRVIKVQHSPTVTTLYAHLSKFDKQVKVGSTVGQRQVIGFVGSSGITTGPHLHYEYHINDQPRDPMTVALSKGKRLQSVERITMLAQRKQWLAMASLTPSV